MPKKMKLKLDDIKVRSFVTDLSQEENADLQGGGDPISFSSSEGPPDGPCPTNHGGVVPECTLSTMPYD